MTPKEKAKELVENYYNLKKHPLISFWRDINDAKQCAGIAANEIIKIVSLYNDTQHEKKYWDEVKLEIEKL
jgi:hypothetical protein